MDADQPGRSQLPAPIRRPRDIESYSPPSPSAEPVQMNMLAAVWRRRWVVLACVALALIAGAIVLMRATPLYGSASTIYVQAAVPKILSDEYSSGSMSTGYLATQCQLITSTAILSQAMEVPGVADAKVLRGIDNPVGYLKYAIAAQPTKLGELIIVSCNVSPNPEDAAVLVNGVVQAYIEYQSKQHQSSAVQVASILQKEMDTHERELKAEQDRMLTLKRDNPALAFRSDKGNMSVTRLSDLTQQLSVAEFRADDLHLALQTAQASGNDPNRLRQLVDQYQLTSLVAPSSVQQLASFYTQQKMQLDELRDTYGTNDPHFKNAQSALNRTQQDLADASQQNTASCLDAIRTASAMADDKVKQLQLAIDAERTTTMGLSATEAEFDQLAAGEARNERALDVLDGRLKDIRVTEDVGPMTISVLEAAKPNPLPVSPIPSHILGEALVAGLMVGLGAALLLDKVDQRLRSVDEIASLLDAPVLGVIPRVASKLLPGEVGRAAQLRPRSGLAEAFRTIRTAIYFGGGDDRSVKTILITSPAPGDGKSSSASNLAIAIAQAGRRVLLIDADCRRPTQHKTFKLADGAGLSTVLNGRTPFDEAVRSTDLDRLDVLPCGPLPHNPAELLDSQALLDLLGEVGRRYDQVLIDSPPVNLVSDARILAASCDAALLVLRADRSTRRGTAMAWNALASVGANLLGVIVNDVSNKRNGYTYYGYGRYGRSPTLVNGDTDDHATNGTPASTGNGKVVISSTD